jgi:peptide/nickel transport system substrate-binding protein
MKVFARWAAAIASCAWIVLSIVFSIALAPQPALAQKSSDTVRIALSEPIVGVDAYFDPKEETSLSMRAVFDTLIYYDEFSQSLQPLLAKAWRRISPTVLEFDLRDDVKWHDGAPFTADDVVYTFRWLIDPNNKLRFTSNYIWVKAIEKVGPATVRIESREPYALDLLRIAFGFHILPEHIHAYLKDKSTFGLRPVGTGPYRAISVSQNNGIVLERVETYRHGGTYKAPTNVRRFHLVPMPDKQTQIAQLLTDGLELVPDVTQEQADAFAANPQLAATTSTGSVYIYLLLDAKGRSGNKPLQDVRVRRAVYMALDRDKLAKSLVSREGMPLDAICFAWQFGCEPTVKARPYDPAAAKQLIADAGYASGFDVEIVAMGRSTQLAEAIANSLRVIGVRATVRPVTMVAYRRMQQDGQYSALVGSWTSYGGTPDVGAHMDFFYGAANRDFSGDARLAEIARQGERTLDPDTRRALYREALDRVNDNAYVEVISTLPAQFLHSSALAVRKGSIQGLGFSVFDLSWK